MIHPIGGSEQAIANGKVKLCKEIVHLLLTYHRDGSKEIIQKERADSQRWMTKINGENFYDT